MRTKLLLLLLSCTMILAMGLGSGAEAEHRLGAGVHYWTALDKFEEAEIDDKGFGGLISYQYLFAGLFRVEADLEILQEGFAGFTSNVYTPVGYLLLGRGLYGGVGVGMGYSDGKWANDPFFALRAGFDINILPKLHLDLNANYRFINWKFEEVKEDIDLDTVTLGAVLRFAF